MGRFPVALKADRKRRLLVVHHTHWDREWYYPYGSFQYRLLRATLRVLQQLDSGEITRFLFDGQTVVLDDLAPILSNQDYLRLKRAIAEGRIEVGPWYVLPDEFLVSGEALIRNLQMGLTAAYEAGSQPACLYLPDLFGHLSQIPQLATQLNLSWAVIFRGAPADVTNVVWYGADGSQVKTHVLPRFAGYYNPIFNSASYLEALNTFLEDMVSICAPREPMLLLAGADHTVPPADWQNKLSTAAAAHPELEIAEVGLGEALRELESYVAAAEIQGEQRDNRKAFLLSGILSSRQYLKRLNRRAEERLSGVLEPLMLWETPGYLQPRYLEWLWGELLKNQPHDSIGGCSIDQVHRTNVSRYEELLAGIDRYIHDVLRRVLGFRPGSFQPILQVWNLLPWEESSLAIEAVVQVPQAVDRGSIRLLSNGIPVGVDTVARWEHDGFYSEMENAPDWMSSVAYRILFPATFQGMQARKFVVEPVAKPFQPAPVGTALTITNDALQLRGLSAGSIQLTDRRSGVVVDDAVALFADEDQGDSYTAVSVQTAQLRLIEFGEAQTGMHTAWMSARYAAPRGGSIELTFTLRRGESFVRVSAVVDNRIENRRYQIRIRLPESAHEHYSDTAFDIVRRTNRRQRYHWTAPQTEAPESSAPTSSLVWAGGITVIHDGLHEYEFAPDAAPQAANGVDDGGAIYLTLLRGTGMLSKGPLPNRGGGAGPHIPTPEGQCLGVFQAELAIAFCQRIEAPALARRFLQPPITFQGQVGMSESSQLILDTRTLIMSAHYPLDEHRRVLRLWNPSETVEHGTLRFTVPVDRQKITLEEERQYRAPGALQHDNADASTAAMQELRVRLHPKQIYSIIYSEAPN